MLFWILSMMFVSSIVLANIAFILSDKADNFSSLLGLAYLGIILVIVAMIIFPFVFLTGTKKFRKWWFPYLLIGIVLIGIGIVVPVNLFVISW